MRRRILAGMLVFMLAALASGCWDRVEIEEKGFVIGVAIDFPPSKEVEEKAKETAPGKPVGKRRYSLTQQFVLPGGMQGEGGGQGGSTSGDAFLNLTAEGDSMFEIVRSVAARTSRSPFYEHIKIIVISEDVAKSGGFADTLDYFIRHPEMRRGTKVLISKGEARKVLEINPKTERLPVMYINSISRNQFKNARMLPPTLIGDVHEQLLKGESYTIQRVTAGKNEVKIAGLAVFHGHNNKMIGWLGEEETEGRNFITGEIRGGLVEAKIGDNLVIYEIKKAQHKVTADVRNKDNIKFKISIETEGRISESLETQDYLQPQVLEKVEREVSEQIERLANDAINKSHKVFKVDVLELGTYLNQTHYDVWKQIKDEWDHGRNYYAKSKIEVEATADIRSMGTIIRNERKPKE
jgi:spore germination protein